MLTRAAAVPGPGAHGADTLGGDHEVGPSALEPQAEDLLGASHCVEAPAEWIDVGGVEKGDPARRRAIEDGNGRWLVALHAEGHRAETQTRDGQARAAESDVAHDLWDQHDLAKALRLHDCLAGARRPGERDRLADDRAQGPVAEPNWASFRVTHWVVPSTSARNPESHVSCGCRAIMAWSVSRSKRKGGLECGKGVRDLSGARTQRCCHAARTRLRDRSALLSSTHPCPSESARPASSACPTPS